MMESFNDGEPADFIPAPVRAARRSKSRNCRSITMVTSVLVTVSTILLVSVLVKNNAEAVSPVATPETNLGSSGSIMVQNDDGRLHSFFSPGEKQPEDENPNSSIMEAVAVINIGTVDSGISGEIIFTQQDDANSPVSVKGSIHGLPPDTVHGFHIHENGDTRNVENPCNSAGAHFNPEMRDHGSPEDSVRHVGDLGNILADENGVAMVDIVDPKISLIGPNSVVGRAVMVHQLRDDLGRGEGESKKTGNAGVRIGCAIIGTIYKNPVQKPSHVELA